MQATPRWINGRWKPSSGELFSSINPSTGDECWSGNSASSSEVEEAFHAARNAFPSWRRLSLEDRAAVCERFAEQVKSAETDFVQLLSQETGKPLWEAKGEVAAVIGKVALSIAAIKERRWTTEDEIAGAKAVTRYRPHGVLAVLGPFNFPAHLPNGHIVPALLAGNTVVFKPSELTPAVGERMIQCWESAGLPAGVVNLVQGGRQTGQAIVESEQLDGLLFTGSSQTGIHFLKTFATQPGKIIALEMGGNNPLIVHDVADHKAAAYLTVLSAFITGGQRCTCARRLILIDGDEASSILSELVTMTSNLSCGLPSDDPEPFIGPLVSANNAKMILQAQENLIEAGGIELLKVKQDSRSEALLHPGIIDITSVETREDREWFGPMLQVIRVADFKAAIEVANQTSYGLAAGLISDSREKYEEYLDGIRAGIVNWNRQTTGASGRLPFGGIGKSGNHRPSGFFAADYCSYPMASIESEVVELPEKLMPGIFVSTT